MVITMAEKQNIVKIPDAKTLAALILRGPGAYVEGKMTITRTGCASDGKDVKVHTRLRVDYNGARLQHGLKLAFNSDRISVQDGFRGLPEDDQGNALFLQGMQCSDLTPVELGPNGKEGHKGTWVYDATSRLFSVHSRDARQHIEAPPTDEENEAILEGAIERMDPKKREAYLRAQLEQLEG